MPRKFPKKITANIKTDFTVDEFGLYAISITASCEKEHDLRVEIDGRLFREIPALENIQKYDIAPAWNGTKLKGLKKTVIFLLNLGKGQHEIEFFPRNQAMIEGFSYRIIADTQKIDFDLGEQAQDGDRRPWVTFALIDLPLKLIGVEAEVAWRWVDGDDVKLIIDNKIEENPNSKLWKNWAWHASPLKIFSETQKEEKTFTKNLSQGTHYLEFWEDRTPILHRVTLDLGDLELKRIPTKEDPKWTKDFNDDTETMLLARLIFGEARSLPEQGRIAVGWSIRNRVENEQWGNTYHKVILQEGQYSALNEGDPNLPFIKDPFRDETQIDDWRECYEIAGKIISGEAEDPTKGANHYFSTFIDPPGWTKSSQAEFKLQIGNTLFYKLNWKQGGFSKIWSLIAATTILALVGFLCFMGRINLACRTGNVNLDKAKTETSGAEKSKHFFIHPEKGEIFKIAFDEQGAFLRLEQLTDDGYPKSHLKVFSDSDRLGYYRFLHKKGDMDNLENKTEREEYYNDYIALMILDDERSEPREIYRGDYHTSDWEPAGSDNKHAIVHYNCGSSCLYAYRINVETGEVEDQYHVN